MKTEQNHFDRLAELEPGLKSLLTKAKQSADLASDPHFCANDLWFREFKPSLLKFVGWSARKHNPELRTEAAYDLAYKTIYKALPDCRDCGCMRTGASDSRPRPHAEPMVDALEIFEYIAGQHTRRGCELLEYKNAWKQAAAEDDEDMMRHAAECIGEFSTQLMLLRELGRYIIGGAPESDGNPFHDGMEI